jgi:predicted adenine nucleotide alpha hydrolase (AANH) superfamily ATPase
LFLQSRGKLLALFILFLVMAVLVIGFSWWDKKKRLPRLLIHACCAPCVAYGASQVLSKDYEITLYFCNPNLDNRDEYERRLQAVRFVAEKYGFGLLVEPYDYPAWKELATGYENEPERGRRCDLCYSFRLSQTAQMAKQKKFDYFTTSLTMSPFKDSAKILALGKELGDNFLAYDFKANGGTDRSLALAKELGLYRQKYCGCEFSNWQKN